MKYSIIYWPNGQIIGVGSFLGDLPEPIRGSLISEIDLETHDRVNKETMAWVNGELVDLPEKPGTHYKYNYDLGTWEYDDSELIKQIDNHRKFLFSESEWIRSKYQDMGLPVPQEWLDYWQALRDITEQPEYPLNFIWPTKPQEHA